MHAALQNVLDNHDCHASEEDGCECSKIYDHECPECGEEISAEKCSEGRPCGHCEFLFHL